MAGDARLATSFWVQAAVKRANLSGDIVTVIARGDPTSGAILVKRNRFAAGFEVLVETRDSAGARAWYRGTGATPVDEPTADAYIERNRRRDPDLWVIEIDDRTGVLPFEETIIRS